MVARPPTAGHRRQMNRLPLLVVLITSTGCFPIYRAVRGLEDPDAAQVRQAAAAYLDCPAEKVTAAKNRDGRYEWTAIGCSDEVACKGSWSKFECRHLPLPFDGFKDLTIGDEGVYGVTAELAGTGCKEPPYVVRLVAKERDGTATFGADLCGRQFKCVSQVNRHKEITEATACTEFPESAERTARLVAVDRLALETNCPAREIKMSDTTAWARGGERAYRMTACGKSYVCTTAANRTDCKAALDAEAPAAGAEAQ